MMIYSEKKPSGNIVIVVWRAVIKRLDGERSAAESWIYTKAKDWCGNAPLMLCRMIRDRLWI
jgi:hypothetical protein|tara:strand:+ start:1966 stop:2151 length:186 start_codon:yes stop_codon:yes gene_type:complete